MAPKEKVIDALVNKLAKVTRSRPYPEKLAVIIGLVQRLSLNKDGKTFNAQEAANLLVASYAAFGYSAGASSDAQIALATEMIRSLGPEQAPAQPAQEAPATRPDDAASSPRAMAINDPAYR